MGGKFHFLQILRAVAAMLVVVDHVIAYIDSKKDVGQELRVLAWFLGIFGVDMFFIISGLIMIHTSRRLFNTKWGFLQFALKRVVRIVPLYWAATIIATLLLTWHKIPAISEILCSLMFLPLVTEVGHAPRPILFVGWTLNLEMFFYAIFTVSLLFSRRVGTVLLISVLTILVSVGSFLKPISDTTDPVTVTTFLSNPIMLLFAAGVILGLMIEKLETQLNRVPFADTLSVALICAAIAIFVGVTNSAPWPLSWELFFWAVCFAIVLLAAVAPARSQSRVFALLELFGDASFSVYLFHFIIIAAVGRLWQTLFGGVGGVVFAVTAFVVASGSGILIHLSVERPLLIGIRRAKFGIPAAAAAFPKFERS